MSNLYAVEISDKVSYVKTKEEFYIHIKMNDLERLYPYVTDKRGIYILTGNNKQLYVGEGDIYNRLKRHKKNKEWTEDVYVYMTPNMTKEESLELEGSFYHYLNKNSDYKVTNKDKVRDNQDDMTYQVDKLKWLGLTVNLPKQTTIYNLQGERVFYLQHTAKDTYKVVEVYKEGLEYLEEYEFLTIRDVQVVVNTIGGNVGG